MTEFGKKPVVNKATAAAVLVLKEPPSSSGFEHTGGRQKQTDELRDSHDNSHNHKYTNTVTRNADIPSML